jgi:hypothetical protein
MARSRLVRVTAYVVRLRYLYLEVVGREVGLVGGEDIQVVPAFLQGQVEKGFVGSGVHASIGRRVPDARGLRAEKVHVEVGAGRSERGTQLLALLQVDREYVVGIRASQRLRPGTPGPGGSRNVVRRVCLRARESRGARALAPVGERSEPALPAGRLHGRPRGKEAGGLQPRSQVPVGGGQAGASGNGGFRSEHWWEGH